MPATSSSAAIVPADFLVAGSIDAVARRRACAAGAETAACAPERLACRPPASPTGVEAADRLRVVDELVDRHLIAALEEPPPARPRLAAVVLEQLAGEPPRRARRRALDELPAQRVTLARLRVVARGSPRAAACAHGAPCGRWATSQSRRASVARQSSSLYAAMSASCAASRAVHPPLVRQHGARAALHVGAARRTWASASISFSE